MEAKSVREKEQPKTKETFEPKIVAFMCNWCAYSGADLAGVSRLQSSPNIRIIRTMCSGRVDPAMIMRAFELGADGVLVAGCHFGDCHYIEGNYKTMRRIELLKMVLARLGIDERRLRLEWISASEAEKYARVSFEFTEQIRELGPLELRMN
ncbi:MAG: hydrogenase iron-sulfur subunit [Calditrichaeota bacterium]|nr:MAG: hydrogenase iron-sulfur subunit [Calditrichota bacterium]